jgi:hypothetical protein
MTSITRAEAERLARNLTASYESFTNHKLITEGCIYEYVHTRTDPARAVAGDHRQLYEGVSQVCAQGEVGVMCVQMYSHFWYTAPASLLASLHDRSQRAPAFLYSFEHVSENQFVDGVNTAGKFG